MPKASWAVTVTVKAEPAVLLAGAARLSWDAAAGLTAMPDCVPVMLDLAESVAVIDWVPAVFKVTLKAWTPLSAVVNV